MKNKRYRELAAILVMMTMTVGSITTVAAETKAYFTYWEKVRSRKKRIDIIGEPEYSE